MDVAPGKLASRLRPASSVAAGLACNAKNEGRAREQQFLLRLCHTVFSFPHTCPYYAVSAAFFMDFFCTLQPKQHRSCPTMPLNTTKSILLYLPDC